MFHQWFRSVLSSRRRVVLVLAALVACVVALTASAFYPEPMFTWENTAGAKAALAGTCSPAECVEWCRIEGDLHIPLGKYCCGPPDPTSPECNEFGGPSHQLY